MAGLFGMSSDEVKQLQQDEFRAFGIKAASNARNSREALGVQLGASIGSALGQGIGNLFGLQDPRLKRASTLETIFRDTQKELGDAAQDPGLLYNELSRKLGQAGFANESLTAGMEAARFNNESLKTRAEIQAKQAQTMSYIEQGKNAQVERKAKILEQQGQVAFGFLNAYDKATDVESKNQVWTKAMSALSAAGIDPETIKDLPEAQRKTFLEQIVDTSSTSATRLKEEMLSVKNEQFQQKMEFQTALANQREAMAQERNTLMSQIANMQVGSRERIASEQKVNQLGSALEKIEATFKNNAQLDAIRAVDAPEWNTVIKKKLTTDLGIEDKKEIAKVLPAYNSKYRSLLSERTSQGLPKYSPSEAESLATDYVRQGVKITKNKILPNTVEFTNPTPAVIKLN